MGLMKWLSGLFGGAQRDDTEGDSGEEWEGDEGDAGDDDDAYYDPFEDEDNPVERIPFVQDDTALVCEELEFSQAIKAFAIEGGYRCEWYSAGYFAVAVEALGIDKEFFLAAVHESKSDTGSNPFHGFSKKCIGESESLYQITTDGMRLLVTLLDDGDLRADPV